MGKSDEAQLQAAIWKLHDALQRRDGIEARLRSGEHDEKLYDRSLAASESVVHARLSLYLLLVAQGWTPPPHISEQLDVDTRLMAEENERLIV